MLSPVRVDAIVDLAYGALIALSVVLIATIDTNIGVAFGVGVFASYVIHVVWKMARFDPNWMTQAVEETVEKTVGDTVEERVGETVEETVGETVEETVGETVEERVGETVEEKVGETVEETVGETVHEAVERSVGEQLADVQTQVEAVEERVGRRPREDEVEELIENAAGEDAAGGASGERTDEE